MTSGWRDRIGGLVLVTGLVHAGVAWAETTQSISIRGREQTLHNSIRCGSRAISRIRAACGWRGSWLTWRPSSPGAIAGSCRASEPRGV